MCQTELSKVNRFERRDLKGQFTPKSIFLIPAGVSSYRKVYLLSNVPELDGTEIISPKNTFEELHSNVSVEKEGSINSRATGL